MPLCSRIWSHIALFFVIVQWYHRSTPWMSYIIVAARALPSVAAAFGMASSNSAAGIGVIFDVPRLSGAARRWLASLPVFTRVGAVVGTELPGLQDQAGAHRYRVPWAGTRMVLYKSSRRFCSVQRLAASLL